MHGLKAYLVFKGNCEAALKFYAKHLDGKINHVMYFEETPVKVPASQKKKVFHAEFEFWGGHFLASDTMPKQKITIGSNILMSPAFDDLKKMQNVFKKMSAGGKVTMPLEKMFWGSTLGSFIDKFGIPWYFYFSPPRK